MNKKNLASIMLLLVLVCSCSKKEQAIIDDKGGTCIKGNCRYGMGIYIYPNGDRYEGEFRSGVPFGYGTMYYRKINKPLTGRWKWGRPDVSR